MKRGGERPKRWQDPPKMSGWWTPKGGVNEHRVSGASTMREHKKWQRDRASRWREATRLEREARQMELQALTKEALATPAPSKSAKRKARRKKSATAQQDQYMAGKLAELQNRFGVDYGD